MSFALGQQCAAEQGRLTVRVASVATASRKLILRTSVGQLGYRQRL